MRGVGYQKRQNTKRKRRKKLRKLRNLRRRKRDQRGPGRTEHEQQQQRHWGGVAPAEARAEDEARAAEEAGAAAEAEAAAGLAFMAAGQRAAPETPERPANLGRNMHKTAGSFRDMGSQLALLEERGATIDSQGYILDAKGTIRDHAERHGSYVRFKYSFQGMYGVSSRIIAAKFLQQPPHEEHYYAHIHHLNGNSLDSRPQVRYSIT
jgi:hypothetical protein